jgi:polyferredoxin
VDVNEKSTWKDFIKSKLFFMPTLRIIQNILYVIILAIVLWIFVGQNVPDLHLVIYWAIVGLVIQIPFTVYTYYIAKKEFPIKIPKNSIIKYSVTSIVSIGISYSLFENFVEYDVSIFKFLPNLLLFILIGMSMYFIITYFIDVRTKKLIKSAIKEILKKN